MKQLDTKLMHPADQITVVISRIYRSGLTTTSGGNISIKDENGDIWITPGGIDKGSLTPKDIICVKPDGTIIGPHKPSSEFPFHKAIYEMRPKMTAVIHAHRSASRTRYPIRTSFRKPSAFAGRSVSRRTMFRAVRASVRKSPPSSRITPTTKPSSWRITASCCAART